MDIEPCCGDVDLDLRHRHRGDVPLLMVWRGWPSADGRATRGRRAKTSDSGWTRLPAVELPQCSLGRELSASGGSGVRSRRGDASSPSRGGPALRARREPSAHVAVSVVACDQRRGARAWRGAACSDDAARRADIGWVGSASVLLDRTRRGADEPDVSACSRTIACRLDVCGKTEAAGQRGVVEEGDLLDPVAAQGKHHHAPGL